MKKSKKKNIKKRKKSVQKSKANVRKVSSSKKKTNKKKTMSSNKKKPVATSPKKNNSSKNLKSESKPIIESKKKNEEKNKPKKDLNTKELTKKENKNLKPIPVKIKGKEINQKDKKNTKKLEKEKVPKKLSKKTKNKLILISIFCLMIFIILIFPYGSTNYKSEASGKILDVPKFSKLSEECCMYNASFTSIRSYLSLKLELENIISKYKEIKCSGSTYYYNEKEDFTIIEYGVDRGLIFNKFYITYNEGNYCEIDKTLKNIELLPDSYSIDDAKRYGNYTIIDGEVYNKDSYDEFRKNVDEKVPSTLRIAKLTDARNLILIDVKYLEDGKFKVIYDNTRDHLDGEDNKVMIAYLYDHLGVYNNKLYAYNGSSLNEFLLNTSNAYYLFDIN